MNHFVVASVKSTGLVTKNAEAATGDVPKALKQCRGIFHQIGALKALRIVWRNLLRWWWRIFVLNVLIIN